ncbi:MAG: NAD-dependent epimerase/dehydratase family protein, partial [Armatimonadaceae bacterium]
MPSPEHFADLADYDTFQSEPTAGVIECLSRITGTLLVLGAGGKMGPTLCRMALRAAAEGQDPLRVVAVSRFGDASTRAQFDEMGCETIAADLLDVSALASLPEAQNIVYLAGQKFGSQHDKEQTWRMNAVLPSMVAERFPGSRFAVLSTGNVYPFSEPVTGGPLPNAPIGPIGHYAESCVAREQAFADAAAKRGTKSSILRLNYANELRYGVLTDIARKVWSRQPVDVSMGAVNVLFQGDACAWTLQSLALADNPPRILNLAGPETIGIRELAEWFGTHFGIPVSLSGTPAPTSLLSNGAETHAQFGYPRVSLYE